MILIPIRVLVQVNLHIHIGKGCICYHFLIEMTNSLKDNKQDSKQQQEHTWLYNNHTFTDRHVNNSSDYRDRVAFPEHKDANGFCPPHVIQTFHHGLKVVGEGGDKEGHLGWGCGTGDGICKGRMDM